MEDSSRFLANQTELNSTQQDELQQEYRKYYKTSLIVALLKQTDAPISVEHRALLGMYKHETDVPFGLDHIRTINLDYNERQSIGKYVEAKIIEQVRPFVDKAKRFTDNRLDDLAIAPFGEQNEILQFDIERQQLSAKLAKLKTQKLQLMKACADIRTGPYQRNNVELKHAETRLLQAKAELVFKLTKNEILNCTPHAMKAIKEVAANVSTLLGNDH
ncbi:uncharacterized protein LOC126570397 [Anopheles aquasalis]|uniref:uncharacterized protein LOC126570397 n=1 Tax=Anopheles aquasalis TaxID=42839 RepID=UPI00215AF808|nr:uncharacterized protein LOC126570397 [Anopheles aquasalis]